MKPVELPKKYEGPILTLKKITIIYSDSGLVRTKLRAPLQYEYQDQNKEFPEGVHIDFFDGNDKITSTLLADYGVYESKTNSYMVRGNVHLTSHDQKHLYSEVLHWLPDTKKITSDKFVKIETSSDTLMGMGLESNENFSRYKILNPSGKFSSE